MQPNNKQISNYFKSRKMRKRKQLVNMKVNFSGSKPPPRSPKLLRLTENRNNNETNEIDRNLKRLKRLLLEELSKCIGWCTKYKYH